MGDLSDESVDGFELLKRLGARWAVLTAMTADMAGKGIKLPSGVVEDLKTVRIKLGSGCFSSCEVGCGLSRVEGQVFTFCHLLGDKEVEGWSALLAEAAQGKLTYHRIRGVTPVSPLKGDCEFLKCVCSES